MKIKYQFANDSIAIEVSDDWGNILIDLDRQEYNVNQKETRRHVSLNGMDYEGDIFADDIDIENDIIQTENFAELALAIKKLKPAQQSMVNEIFFKGMSISSYAAKEGVNHSAISHRLKTVYKKLKNFI